MIYLTNKMISKKFRLYKKGGMEDMPISEGMIGPILTLVVIIAISLFLFALWNWHNSNQENQANMNNYEELYRRIESLDDGEEITHPIYLKEFIVIYGFEKDKNEIKGKCRWKVWGLDFLQIPIAWGEVKKPIISCGNKGCLCMAKQDYVFGTGTRMKEDILVCKSSKYSIVGGEVDSGKYCDFAMVIGGKEVRNVYLNRDGESVKLCADKCT